MVSQPFVFRFTLNDSFIGYSSDTKAAVVLQASYLYGMSKPAVDEGSNEWKEKVYMIIKLLHNNYKFRFLRSAKGCYYK